MIISAIDPDNQIRGLTVDADGKLQTTAVLDATGLTIPPPVGGATEAKQDTQITKLGGGLPVALTASGNFKSAIQEALPAGTNTIGATKPSGLTAKGYQQITSLSAASALTVPSGSTCALIQAETQSIRWRDDGTNPTSSVGMIIAAGESLFFTGSLSAFRGVETTASAKLNVSYYG